MVAAASSGRLAGHVASQAIPPQGGRCCCYLQGWTQCAGEEVRGGPVRQPGARLSETISERERSERVEEAVPSGRVSLGLMWGAR